MLEALGVGKFARYLIEQQPEGAYLFVFETTDSKFPEWDYLLDVVEDAKEQAIEDYGVPMDAWSEVDHPSLTRG